MATVRWFAKPFFTPTSIFTVIYEKLPMNNTCGDVWHKFALDKLYSGAGPNTASYTHVDSEAGYKCKGTPLPN